MNDKNLTLREKIEQGLSYTSQSYEEILQDLINLFIGENAITTEWNNIAETDLFFIMLSLIASHRDMQNYMLDYRVRESNITTAKESANIIRILKSFGYRVPIKKASRIKLELPNIVLNATDVKSYSLIELTNNTKITDDNGVVWTYGGQSKTLVPKNALGSDNKIIDDTNFRTWLTSKGHNPDGTYFISSAELVQGERKKLQLLSKNFNNETITHTLPSPNLALGHSKLYLYNSPTNKLDEADSIYSRGVQESYNIFMIDVDTQGVLYIKLSPKQTIIDITSETQTLGFEYIDTDGKISKATTFTLKTQDAPYKVVLGDSSLTLSNLHFLEFGRDVLTASELKEDFKLFMNSRDNLITLQDIYNWVKNKQTVISSDYITDVLVADAGGDTKAKERETGIPLSKVKVYLLLRKNSLSEFGDATLIKNQLWQELALRGISGIGYEVFIYDKDTTPSKVCNVSFATPTADLLSGSIMSYLNENIGIGNTFTTNDVYDLLYENYRVMPTEITFIDTSTGDEAELNNIAHNEYWLFVKP